MIYRLHEGIMYKLGAHNFVYLWTGLSWIRSSKTLTEFYKMEVVDNE